MTSTFRTMAAWAAITALSAAVAGCSPAANNTASSTSSTTTTTTTASTTTAPPADTNTAMAATNAATPASATAANIPSECQAYAAAVQACAERVSSSSPTVAAQVRQNLEAQRQSWATVPNQQALASACTTMTNAFNASARSMGC